MTKKAFKPPAAVTPRRSTGKTSFNLNTLKENKIYGFIIGAILALFIAWRMNSPLHYLNPEDPKLKEVSKLIIRTRTYLID